MRFVRLGDGPRHRRVVRRWSARASSAPPGLRPARSGSISVVRARRPRPAVRGRVSGGRCRRPEVCRGSTRARRARSHQQPARSGSIGVRARRRRRVARTRRSSRLADCDLARAISVRAPPRPALGSRSGVVRARRRRRPGPIGFARMSGAVPRRRRDPGLSCQMERIRSRRQPLPAGMVRARRPRRVLGTRRLAGRGAVRRISARSGLRSAPGGWNGVLRGPRPRRAVRTRSVRRLVCRGPVRASSVRSHPRPAGSGSAGASGGRRLRSTGLRSGGRRRIRDHRPRLPAVPIAPPVTSTRPGRPPQGRRIVPRSRRHPGKTDLSRSVRPAVSGSPARRPRRAGTAWPGRTRS
jgi:hypothetical protein